MKRGTYLTFAAVVVAAVAGILLDSTRVLVGTVAGDAFFQSRPTRYWAEALRGDPESQANALLALQQGGTDAVPILIEILRDYTGEDAAPVRWQAAELLGKRGVEASAAGEVLISAMDDRDSHVCAVSIASLPRIGVAAGIGVPLLAKRIRGEHGVVATRALSEYRAAAAPALEELRAVLGDTQLATELRWNAARTIGKIGPEALAAVPDLIAWLSDPESTIREHCAEAIGDIGPDVGAEAITALVGMLDDPAVRVRRDAVRSLGTMGPRAAATLPKVQQLLKDPEELVRLAAQDAVKRIAPAAETGPASTGDQVQPADKPVTSSK